jgi:HEAT repeat protein
VQLLARRSGNEAVAAWCAELLRGTVAHNDPRRPSITWLGGRHGAAEPYQDYWPRVWAARGLLYVWRPTAELAVLAGLRDPAWRVREMCAKVARRHALHRAEPVLTHLLDDRVLRVRAAAEAALTESARSPD